MARTTPDKNHQKSKASKNLRVRRFNWKGMAYLGVGLVAALGLSFPLKYWNQQKVRDSALDQAKASQEKGDLELAIRHLDRFLADRPNDVPALQARADLVVKSTRSGEQLLDAANTLDLLIRLDPNGKDRDVTRRKLAELYITYSDHIKDFYRRFGENGADQDSERKQLRYNAAAGIANQLIKKEEAEKTQDGDAHRLLAMAMEGQDSDLRNRQITEQILNTKAGADPNEETKSAIQLAVENYRTAIRINPRDMVASERLANLYMTRLKDPASADAILDAMLKADDRSVQVRMARFGAYIKSKRDDLAKAELDAAMAMAPDNLPVRYQAINFALTHRNTAEARRLLDALPADRQNDLQVKVLRGYLEIGEQHPEQAIDQWRRGLSIVGGGDQMLTWQLAFNLIRLGRLAEADPLVKQYNRLANGDKTRSGRFLEGMYALNSGHINEATKIFEKIKEVVPTDLKAELLLNLGKCYELRGEENNALIAYRNAATAAPASPRPRLEVARMIQKHHPEDAIAELDRALSESPDDPNLLMQMIRIRIARQQALLPAQRQWGEVKELLARAEKLAPNNWVLRNLNADYMAASGKLSEAVDMLGAAARGGDRTRAESWISWAQGLERMGRRDEAIKALDEAARAENAGDRARLRIAKARLLARSGRGQAAREALTLETERVPEIDLAELAQAKAELLRELGDREGCRAAYVEWATLAPQSPRPGLALFDLAQVENDEQAAKLGLEALRAIGGDNQPYGMAARAFDLLRVDPRGNATPTPERLDQADWLVRALRQEAPSLRLGHLLGGMIAEFRGNLDDAIKSYQYACKDDPISFALPKLIEAYMKARRYEDLDRLKKDVEQEALARQLPGVIAEFDRIAGRTALRLGDKDRADFYASRVVEGQAETVQGRAAYARMLDNNGKPDEAFKALVKLTDDRKSDPFAWLTLIAFEAIRKTPADVARTIQKARKECKVERPELFLAQCYWIGNDLPNAKPAYQKAVEARPDDLTTLKSLVEFLQATSQVDRIEPVLRKVLQVDSTASWAARMLADRISARSDPATWPEAWSLVAPGSSASGDTPEDRLLRATVLARSPESARRAEAIPAFVALANDLPISNPLAVDTRTRLSQAMSESGRYAEAWEYIKPIADDPVRANATALVIGIEALARSNRPEEAERRLDRLAALEPRSPQVPLSRGWVLMARGKKAEASAAAESAYDQAKDAPNAEVVALAALELLIKFGDLDGALRLGGVVVKRWPKDAWTLARVQIERKEYDQALATCRTAFDAGATREALRYAVTAAIARRDDAAFLKQVSDLGDRVRSKAPDDANVLIFLGTLRHVQGRYEDEMAFYRAALERNPVNVQFLNNMAWTLCEGLHRPDEALKVIEEAIRREGKASQYLDTRGVIRSRQGKFAEAIDDLEQSVKLEPLATSYFHLARTYSLAGKPEEVRRCRDLALKAKFDREGLDPTDRADLDKVMGAP